MLMNLSRLNRIYFSGNRVFDVYYIYPFQAIYRLDIP